MIECSILKSERFPGMILLIDLTQYSGIIYIEYCALLIFERVYRMGNEI